MGMEHITVSVTDMSSPTVRQKVMHGGFFEPDVPPMYDFSFFCRAISRKLG
jgi:hypothetical protein